MKYDSSRIIQSELNPKERLIWSGQPLQGFKLRKYDAFFIPFSFLWGGGAIFWEYNVIHNGAPLFFAIFGIPFVIVGFYIMLGRFYVDTKLREKTFYGITNERVIIASGFFNKTVEFLDLKTLTDISVSEIGNGIGTITFGKTFFAEIFGINPWPGMNNQNLTKFDLITDVMNVYHKILDAKNNIT